MPVTNPNEEEFEALITSLNAQLQADTHKYGITPEELTQLQNLTTHYRNKRQEKRAKALEAQAATAAFNNVAKEAKPFVSRVRQRMNLHPEMNSEGRQLYDLAQRGGTRSPLSVPDVAPLIKLDFGTRGRMTISIGPNPTNARRNGKPKGAATILVQCHEGGVPTSESEWQHLAQVTSSPVTHQPSSGTHTFAYRACYVDRKGNRGPWRENATGTILG
jgi:hypothetical protein